MKLTEQDVKDWENHPITINFREGVVENIKFYENLLANLDSDFNSKEVARRIGVKQGLEALLTYEPEIDSATGEFAKYEEI